MTDDRAAGIEQKLEALVTALHKKEVSDTELKGDMKLLRQSMQNMETNFTLANQSISLRINKLEDNDKAQTTQIADMKNQLARTSGIFSILAVIGLSVVNFIQNWISK